MAVFENMATEDGDVLRIITETPIIGLISLSQFVDITHGEVTNDYFRKEFRYSVNGGLTFEEWTELTLLNISNTAIVKYDSFVLEYRYIRVGSTPAVTLSFDEILVSGVVEDLPYPVFEKSAFIKFFPVNDLEVFGWALNVLEKLYQKGFILPDYIQRAENQSNLEDEDFIVYWNSITHLFAIVVYFARQFQNFNTNQILLEQFLKSKDLIIPLDFDSADIQYLYDHYVEEYEKRGTLQILDRKEAGAATDGELIRILGSQMFEEFIFSLFQSFESGWCLGKSSPTWKGTENIKNLRKGYEFQNEVLDLTLYPIVEPTYVSKVAEQINIINVPNATLSGIGGITKMINIDSSQDYEISFRVSQTVVESNLVFGCRVFDKNGSELTGATGLRNISTLLPTNDFFYQEGLKIANKEYWVRGVLYHYGIPAIVLGQPTVQLIPSIGVGDNMIFPESAAKIVPTIAVYGSGSANTIKIDSVVIRPLKLNFSRGQLGIHNIIYLMARNNNGELTNGQLEQFIKSRLIPYNSTLKTKFYE
jgi:hypothetical protein